MLVDDVDKGFDKGGVSGYSVAGKTGTAQIPSANGGYEKDAFINDFLGFAPASNPKFTILVKMDDPEGGTVYAANSLSPVFADIAKYLINYYNLPPDR
jgi:cell division protein FtsI/penicillin-binding protein 2